MNIKDMLQMDKLDVTGNTSSLISEQISRLIITHKLPPHFVFPNENEFCKELGVGRSTLREAYKVLESNSLILRTKRGTFVNDLDTIIGTVPFNTNTKISDLNDFIEFRIMFESELAELAAKRANDEHLTNMRLFVDLMKENCDNLVKLTYYDIQFHMEVAKASCNKLLISTMNATIDTFAKFIYNSFQLGTEESIEQALSYHEGIIFAIQQKDSTIARNTMRSHVNNCSKRILKNDGVLKAAPSFESIQLSLKT